MENQIKYVKPRVNVLDNGNLELVRDWTVRYNGWLFTVPKGFLSDGNSVPRLFQWLVPKFGRNTIAGIAHDWLYHKGKVYKIVDDGLAVQEIRITQRQADIVRSDLCQWCGVWWIQRIASYIGLRIGGWYGWRQARRKYE